MKIQAYKASKKNQLASSVHTLETLAALEKEREDLTEAHTRDVGDDIKNVAILQFDLAIATLDYEICPGQSNAERKQQQMNLAQMGHQLDRINTTKNRELRHSDYQVMINSVDSQIESMHENIPKSTYIKNFNNYFNDSDIKALENNEGTSPEKFRRFANAYFNIFLQDFLYGEEEEKYFIDSKQSDQKSVYDKTYTQDPFFNNLVLPPEYKIDFVKKPAATAAAGSGVEFSSLNVPTADVVATAVVNPTAATPSASSAIVTSGSAGSKDGDPLKKYSVMDAAATAAAGSGPHSAPPVLQGLPDTKQGVVKPIIPRVQVTQIPNGNYKIADEIAKKIQSALQLKSAVQVILDPINGYCIVVLNNPGQTAAASSGGVAATARLNALQIPMESGLEYISSITNYPPLTRLMFDKPDAESHAAAEKLAIERMNPRNPKLSSESMVMKLIIESMNNKSSYYCSLLRVESVKFSFEDGKFMAQLGLPKSPSLRDLHDGKAAVNPLPPLKGRRDSLKRQNTETAPKKLLDLDLKSFCFKVAHIGISEVNKSLIKVIQSYESLPQQISLPTKRVATSTGADTKSMSNKSGGSAGSSNKSGGSAGSLNQTSGSAGAKSTFADTKSIQQAFAAAIPVATAAPVVATPAATTASAPVAATSHSHPIQRRSSIVHQSESGAVPHKVSADAGAAPARSPILRGAARRNQPLAAESTAAAVAPTSSTQQQAEVVAVDPPKSRRSL